MMYLGCSSQSYDGAIRAGRLSLTEWFRLAAEDLGLRAVEVEDKHLGDPAPARLDDVRGAAGRYGLEIVNVAFMNNFGAADAARRAAEEARTVEWMEVSRRLGSRFLRTFAGWPEGGRDARRPDMMRALRAVCARAEQAGVRLVMENHNHGGFVQTAADVEEIVGGVDSPALGLLLDTGNYLDGMASIARTAGRAWHVHAKCTRLDAGGRDAAVDHEAIIPLLRSAGYAGCVSVEYEGDEPGETAVPRAATFLRGLVEGR